MRPWSAFLLASAALLVILGGAHWSGTLTITNFLPLEKRPEVLVDYCSLPPERPHGWPPIRSNERGLSRLVYGFLLDTLRGVSDHVTIGSAARQGRDLGSWFALCRED